MIEILMADDHAIFRRGMGRLLSDESDMRVQAEAANGPEVIELLRQRSYSVVLLDIAMGARSGLDTLRRIRADWPEQPVLILSMYPESQYAPISLELGANGYLCKDCDIAGLIAAIRIAASGGYYLPASLGPEVRARLHREPGNAAHARLTEREWQILRLIVAGVSLTEIGSRMCLSVKTISTYRARLLGKLGLSSNAELVRYCLANGIAD